MAHDHYASTTTDSSCGLCYVAQAARPLAAVLPQHPGLREVRVGSTDHLTLAARNDSGGATTLCGTWLAGTPVSPNSTGPCGLCQALQPCDECGHPGAHHLNAHQLRDAGKEQAALYIFAHATCWAENVCRSCDADLHNDVLVRTLGADSPAGAGDAVEAYRG